MSNKLVITSMLALFSINGITANQQYLTKEEINKKNKEILAQSGIEMLEYNEINIVSAQKYINTKNIKQNENDAHIEKNMENYLLMNEEQKKNGYVKDYEPRAKELLDFKNTSKYHKNKYRNVYNPESTHIRDSINDLKVAYTFVGVPLQEIDFNIGFAPYGAYKLIKNGDDGDGWDGVVQFFDKNGVGSCAFSEHNRKLSGFGIELIKELVSYDIQNKPTIILIKGTNESGYVYKIKWYDSIFTRELECANTEFSMQIKENIISLANKIDVNQ